MSCHVEEEDISFLYTLQEGLSTESYAMEVALMAGLPKSVVEIAKKHARAARQIQEQTDSRMKKHRENWRLFVDCWNADSIGRFADIQFRILCQINE